MSQFPAGEVLVSSIEHESVLAPAGLFKNRQIPVDKQGLLNLTALEKMISDHTVLISIMLVNNELGGIQPLRETAALARLVRQERLKRGVKTPLYLHTDAAQAANYFDLHASRLGVDLLSLNGGKIYGPKQAGALYVKTGLQLKPLIVGGGQERNLRSGTENVAGIVGLAKALQIAQTEKPAEAKRVRGLRDLLVLLLADLPAVVINGSPKKTAPHILHLSLPGFDGERLMMELDEQGIQCAVGSACSAANTKPSHVLSAIGLPEDIARSSLRFSFGRQTTAADIRQTARALKELTAR
jgi:cysteine desulfurase